MQTQCNAMKCKYGSAADRGEGSSLGRNEEDKHMDIPSDAEVFSSFSVRSGAYFRHDSTNHRTHASASVNLPPRIIYISEDRPWSAYVMHSGGIDRSPALLRTVIRPLLYFQTIIINQPNLRRWFRQSVFTSTTIFSSQQLV